ncbi:unnamed protein product, partial [Owenia fusiformis]
LNHTYINNNRLEDAEKSIQTIHKIPNNSLQKLQNLQPPVGIESLSPRLYSPRSPRSPITNGPMISPHIPRDPQHSDIKNIVGSIHSGTGRTYLAENKNNLIKCEGGITVNTASDASSHDLYSPHSHIKRENTNSNSSNHSNNTTKHNHIKTGVAIPPSVQSPSEPPPTREPPKPPLLPAHRPPDKGPEREKEKVYSNGPPWSHASSTALSTGVAPSLTTTISSTYCANNALSSSYSRTHPVSHPSSHPSSHQPSHQTSHYTQHHAVQRHRSPGPSHPLLPPSSRSITPLHNSSSGLPGQYPHTPSHTPGHTPSHTPGHSATNHYTPSHTPGHHTPGHITPGHTPGRLTPGHHTPGHHTPGHLTPGHLPHHPGVLAPPHSTVTPLPSISHHLPHPAHTSAPNMFAPPLPPPPPLTSTALPPPSGLPGPYGAGAADQALHAIWAQQQQLYGAYANAGLPLPAHSSLSLFDKMPKMESPFYRPGLQFGSYPPGLSMLPPPGSTPTPLGSGIHGAFTPKNAPGNLQHSQLLASIHEREKAAALAANPSLPPPPKKGKWCAVHVRIAWEIYNHQQKQGDGPTKGDGKPAPDLLRPASQLLPGTSIPVPKPPEISASLLPPGPHSRSPLDIGGTPGSLFAQAPLGLHPPFPRPSPYGGLGAPGLGNFGGLGNGSLFGARDMTNAPGLSSPHEWNRLHRTPPSFPTPPAWPKSEAEKDRENADKERRSADRERERENRSSHRSSPSSHSHRSSTDTDRPDLRHNTELRSRSRSPIVRNGPMERRESNSRSNSAFDGESRLKEDRKDVLIIGDNDSSKRQDLLLAAEREQKRAEMLHSHSNLAPTALSYLQDRHRLLGSYGAPSLERFPHPNLWNPFDPRASELTRASLDPRIFDMSRHQMEVQKEMERERERLLHRFPNPPHPSHSITSMLDEQRMREQDIVLRQRMYEHQRRDTERAASYLQDTHPEYDRSKIPPLRPAEPSFLHPHAGSIQYQRSTSPVLNHNGNSKTNSPSSAAGAPPPLIPSASTNHNPHHKTDSPLTKSKSSSPNGLVIPRDKDRRELKENGLDVQPR